MYSNENDPEKNTKKHSTSAVVACIFSSLMLILLIVLVIGRIVKVVGKTTVLVSEIAMDHNTNEEKQKMPVATTECVTTPAKTAEKELHNGIYTAGDYEVGVDIPAGLYVIVFDGSSPDKNGIAQVSSSSDESDKDAVLAGGWFHQNTYLQLEEGQFLHVSWATIYDAEKIEVILDPYQNEGMFCVGKDLPAGTYRLSLNEGEYVYPDSASYTIYSSMASPQPILKETGRYVDTEKDIILEEGQYIMCDDCHLVKAE